MEHTEIIFTLVVIVGVVTFAFFQDEKENKIDHDHNGIINIKEQNRKGMGYIAQTLMSNENVIYQAKISLRFLFTKIVFGVIFLLLALNNGYFIIISIPFFAICYIQYTSTELAFTNKRVIAKYGFVQRNVVELNINKVESIQVQQDISGRMFGYGSIIIAGAGNHQVPIKGISNPMLFRNKFMEYTMDK
ncbi:MAG: PH domain-containing protein [Campylobacteraceae bacterium]|jgi:uncharacterized membrane protein YdbT with pleckstrin-like domain|nr:PH domain-containing protein [Campylobacteraceae bacterium]